MSMEQPARDESLAERLADLEMAFGPHGVLGEIAAAALVEKYALSPQEAAEVILPPRQPMEPYQARWEFERNASERIVRATEARAESVLSLAVRLGMIKNRMQIQADTDKIDETKALFVVEGGANKTSVVRRELAVDAMRLIYGDEDVADQILYQFGSGKYRVDPLKNGQPNPEFDKAQQIAQHHLLGVDGWTQFQVSLASAKQSGYETLTTMELWSDDPIPEIEDLVYMTRNNSPTLGLIQPNDHNHGLLDGLSALANLVHANQLDGAQLVVATNGQYRPKDELQVMQWARQKAIRMSAPTVVLGDEPGDSFYHAGQEITSDVRPPLVYVNEMVLLQRLNSAS